MENTLKIIIFRATIECLYFSFQVTRVCIVAVIKHLHHTRTESTLNHLNTTRIQV